MVLAAGLGTRMRYLTEARPKPLVPVGGKPLIDHVLDKLAAAGVETAVVNVHYFADQIEHHLAGRRAPRIVISDERSGLLGTGGGVGRPGDFETAVRERAALEVRNAERKSSAEQVKVGLDQRSFVVVRQAAETGQLYGSVAARDIVDILAAAGETITRSQVDINTPIKNLGVHNVEIVLHADVRATITLNIARSEEEALRQAKGEDVTAGAREDTFVREVGSVLDDEGMDREEL